MNTQQNKLIVPLLIVIIALLLIGGGLYFYSGDKTAVSENLNSNTNTNTLVTPVVNTNIPPKSNPVTNTQPVTSTSASIDVIYPNGGEMLKEGSTYVIQWSVKNFKGAQNINIIDENNEIVKVLASNIATNNNSNGIQQYSVVLPREFVSEASPRKFRVMITANNNTIRGFSDTPFTISASGKGI